MIRLVPRGPEDSLIEFSPRLKGKGNPITRDLVYGHHCDWCGNVIQAMFLTDEEVRIHPYEATKVISQGDKNEGELLKIVPNSTDRASAYRVDMYRTKNGNAQLIRLKNHMLRWEGVTSGNVDDFFEVGERCCRYAGIYTRNEEEIINEMALVCNYNRLMVGLAKVHIPLSFLSEWKPPYTWSSLNHKLVPAIGKGNTMMMIARTTLKAGVVNGFVSLYDSWDKKVAQEAKEVPTAVV